MLRSKLLLACVAALGIAAATAGPAQGAAIIDNGTVQLGVNDFGDLNVEGGSPSSGGVTVVGLRYIPTNGESTAPGCLCEGWGAADGTSGVSGWANEDEGGPTANLSLVSFTSDANSAVSVVDILDGSSNPVLRVTQDYHPSGASPNLYEVTVTIENVSSSAVDARYRRVMDWDVEPTAFDEFVTIQGGTSTALLFDSDDGFATADPLGGPSQIDFTGNATDSGPDDHGALFDFGFGTVNPGDSKSFRIYYGAAGNESDALAALGAVGAEVYSFGQPSTTDGPTLGTPNTFIFAFAGVGGAPIVQQPTPPSSKPPVVLGEKARSCGGKQPTIIGTGQPETLIGTPGRDVIVGLGGSDVLRGLSGNDVLCGGRAKDRLFGGKGADTLIGGAGRDFLSGGGTRDLLFGGTPGAPPQRSIDTCLGGSGNDSRNNCEKGIG